MVGFFDGMELGNHFSYWGIPEFNTDKANPAAVKAFTSYDSMTAQYLKNVTNLQLKDGVTKFFEDYRNRKILISDAVWIVLNAISGKSDAEMQPLIESYRKNAK